MNFFELDKNLQEIVKDVIPKIVDKEFKTGDKISKDDFEQIFFRLLLKVGADEANYGIKQLNKLLVDSGAINSDENPGISITRINRPSARITVDLAKELCNLSKMDKTFISSLEKKIDCLEIQAGQIFFSVVRFGALLREDLLTIFFSLLGETPNILNGHVWYELKNEEKNINHIWNPDPLTLILLHNWYNDGHHRQWSHLSGYEGKKWLNLITKFLLNQNFILKQKKLNQKHFLALLSARLSLEIPAVLVDCASGIHDSHTLHPDVYKRLITGKSPVLNINSLNVQSNSSNVIFLSSISDTRSQIGVRDKQLITAVGVSLRTLKKQKTISNKIQQLIEKEKSFCAPVTTYLCRWVSKRLTCSNRWGNRFASKSAYTRLVSIARRLQGWLGSEDPTQIRIEKLSEIYAEIIDSVESQSLRLSLAKNLRDFHEYLEDEWRVQSIDAAPWSGVRIGNVKGTVDAKIVLPIEYSTALKYYLEQESIGIDPVEIGLSQARYLTLAFGYRTGLRRREVIGLRMKDITVSGCSEVFVK